MGSGRHRWHKQRAMLSRSESFSSRCPRFLLGKRLQPARDVLPCGCSAVIVRSEAVPGAKRTITDERVQQMIIRTRDPATRGDAMDYARDGEAVGLSQMAISRVCDTFNDVPGWRKSRPFTKRGHVSHTPEPRFVLDLRRETPMRQSRCLSSGPNRRRLQLRHRVHVRSIALMKLG